MRWRSSRWSRHVDDRVTLVWPPHVVEQSVDSVQARLDAVWDVPIEVGEGFVIVHEKPREVNPGALPSISGLALSPRRARPSEALSTIRPPTRPQRHRCQHTFLDSGERGRTSRRHRLLRRSCRRCHETNLFGR